MSSLRFLLRQLEPFVLRTALCPGQDACPDRVELLCTQKTLTADRLYLGDVRAATGLSVARIAPGTTVLLSDACADDLPKLSLPGGSLVLFSCSLAKLYNTLADASARKAGWCHAYQELTDHGGGLHAIVALTAKLAGSAVLLLDHNGRVVAGAGMEGSAYLSGQVAATGALPLRTAELLFGSMPPDGGGSCAIPGTELVLYGRRMAHLGDPFGMLLIEGRQERDGPDVQSLCDCAADCLSRRLLSYDLERLGSSTKLFQQCWEDIVERRLTGSAEIRSALSRMPNPVEPFVQVAVITFAGGGAGVPYNYLLARLRECFPRANLAVYHKDVVILLSYRERTFRPELDDSGQLTRLLERYNGFMAVSNGTRNLDALGSNFLLAKRTALLAQALRKSCDERIFFHEDYSMYCVIDLCVQRYLEIEGNDDVLYLVHPAVILLTRYDSQHNSNLRDVLYYYLLNDRNLVRTAAATYMHRNTVINKVNKILDLLQLDLEDGNLRQRLIFSCQFIRYYENILKREFRP